MSVERYFRRKEAGQYLREKFGFGSPATLAKLACIGGGPEFFKAGSIVLYAEKPLDAWALSKISGPKRSTSDRHAA
jgi:hypothetical protein